MLADKCGLILLGQNPAHGHIGPETEEWPKSDRPETPYSNQDETAETHPYCFLRSCCV